MKRYLGHPLTLLLMGMSLFLVSNGNYIVPVAAWIAPALILRFVRIRKPFPALILVFVLLIIASRIMLAGIIPDLLGFLTYILMIYYALIWFLPFMADRLLASRVNGFASTLVFPAVTVAVEYINTVLYGSWASIAYTQFDNLPLIQFASVFGIWGISFMVAWFAAVINWSLDQGWNWGVLKNGFLVYISCFLLVMIFGGLRLSVFAPDSEVITVASFTPTNELQDYLEEIGRLGYGSSTDMAGEDRQTQSRLLNAAYDRIFQRNRQLLSPDVSLSFWPEGAVRVLEEDEAGFIERGKDLARQSGTYLLMAYFVIPLENPHRNGENKAILVNPHGEVDWEYLKAHPVPGSTDKPGKGVLPLTETGFGRISTAICYDMDFTGLVHQAGHSDVDIMLVPAWDWEAINPLHARMAVFRAIENGFSMVRQTAYGLSIAVDHTGRVLASMDHFKSDDHVLVAQVPTVGVKTIYALIGDLFAWLCLAGVLVTAIRVAWMARSSASSNP